MNNRFWTLLFGCMSMFFSTDVLAEEIDRRVLLVGSNQAPVPLEILRYTHTDVQKMEDVLVEMGGVGKEDITILLDPSSEELDLAFEKMYEGIEENSQLIFYYSGHSNDENLLLGDEQYPLDRIHDFLDREAAQIRLGILDSCQSGAASRTKGGVMRPGVDIRLAVDPSLTGAVLITSSSAQEAALEVDDIGGSLFTHFFVSGLRGAADSNEDGLVTLEEVFVYSSNQTLERSSESRSGTQHPTFEYNLSGQRQLVLSVLQQNSSLTFGDNLVGSYIVFDRFRGQVVAEIAKEAGQIRTLWLPKGDYFVKKRLPNAVLMQKIRLEEKQNHVVQDYAMHTVPFDEDITKGHSSTVFNPSWKYGAPYINGTAHTLRRGEKLIGFTYAAIGLNDDVTLVFSPLYTLLLSPSVHTKVKLLHKEHVVWSMYTGFDASFWDRAFEKSQRSEISLVTGTSFSWLINPSLTWSANMEWNLQSESDYQDKDGNTLELEEHSVGLFSTLTYVFTERNLLQLSGGVYQFVFVPEGVEIPNRFNYEYGLVYAHQWKRMRASIGLESIPSYSILFPDEEYDEEWEEEGFLEGLPLSPTVEVWWRW